MQSDFFPDGPLVFDPHSERASWRLEITKAFSKQTAYDPSGRGLPLARKLSEKTDLAIPSDAELELILHNKLAISRAAIHRARGKLGRLYNRLVGDYPGYIQMSGAHILHTFTLTRFKAPMPLEPASHYCLRQDVAEAALVTLKQRAHS